MNDVRKEKSPIVDDAVDSIAGWLFALVVAAVLAFGAWYVLAVSGTPVDDDTRLGSGQDSAAAQLHLTSTGISDQDLPAEYRWPKGPPRMRPRSFE